MRASRSPALKRMFDLTVSGLALIWALPIIALLMLIVRIDSPGPGIFRQQRVGRGQRLFWCLKIRTMPVGTPNVPTHEVSQRGLTRLGRHLRASKLDELPQLLNVVRGEMSLVGPRPCLPSQAELIDARKARDVFALRPGITGLAQVTGVDMSSPETLARFDELYCKRTSLRLDLLILFRTIVRTGRADRGTPSGTR